MTRRDLERLLGFVGEAESLSNGYAFTPDLLVELGRLIEADWVTYAEVDHVHKRSLAYLTRPGDEDEEEEMTAEAWELMAQHPVCQRWSKDGQFCALRISDVITQREWRRSLFYDLCFKPWGVEHELKVRLLSPPWHARTFMFHRRPGRDFTQRDRLMLDLLTPHLTRLWQAARTRRLLASALRALEQSSETDTQGVVLLGVGGELEFASAPARRLLHEFFPPTTGELLPAMLVDWLSSKTIEPFVRQTDSSRVIVTRTDQGLLLEERPGGIELTLREQEVLRWVARGKTNGEIAELLWLAPSTVRKHLENVYAKLGVSTRTAAVARFLGLLDAEAS